MTQLITDQYREQIRKLHSASAGTWGATAYSRSKKILEFVDAVNTTKILDYGSGPGRLKKKIDEDFPGKYDITNYDPGIDEFSSSPVPHDFVVCMDVLEHIEPECIDNVLDDLKRVTLKGALFGITTIPAHRNLPDGRNAHILIQPYEWWKEKIESRFKINFESHNHASILMFVNPL